MALKAENNPEALSGGGSADPNILKQARIQKTIETWLKQVAEEPLDTTFADRSYAVHQRVFERAVEYPQVEYAGWRMDYHSSHPDAYSQGFYTEKMADAMPAIVVPGETEGAVEAA